LELLQVSNLTTLAPLGAAKTDPAADNNAVLEDAMFCFGFFFLSSPFSRRTRIPTTTITTNSNKTTGKKLLHQTWQQLKKKITIHNLSQC
jgi:hypothetical protein